MGLWTWCKINTLTNNFLLAVFAMMMALGIKCLHAGGQMASDNLSNEKKITIMKSQIRRSINYLPVTDVESWQSFFYAPSVTWFYKEEGETWHFSPANMRGFLIKIPQMTQFDALGIFYAFKILQNCWRTQIMVRDAFLTAIYTIIKKKISSKNNFGMFFHLITFVYHWL